VTVSVRRQWRTEAFTPKLQQYSPNELDKQQATSYIDVDMFSATQTRVLQSDTFIVCATTLPVLFRTYLRCVSGHFFQQEAQRSSRVHIVISCTHRLAFNRNKSNQQVG
jgi:hypothetical protein